MLALLNFYYQILFYLLTKIQEGGAENEKYNAVYKKDSHLLGAVDRPLPSTA